ncbi:phage portal protein [uncultured Cedecea sp.]|uniref:anti-CBASS protein Acb1 family protein n=1 Tax=uncultured Cedecea sp. TaxID=988762 RepID=UPI002626A9DE|nr:anti-CBASS Acb1 family protein [uncultured Cedecea sp.]
MSDNSNEVQFLVNALAEQIGRQRMLYAGRNGNVKRTKLWDEFGYPDIITFDMLYRAYRRNSAAFSGVHKTLDDCWIDLPIIIDGPKSTEATETTKWEADVTKLIKPHWSRIKDADRRNLVGRYSAILLQIKDGRTWDQPVDTAAVKMLGHAALVKLIPAWESQIKPTNHDTDTLSDTYGMPTAYEFNEQPVGDDGTYGIVRSVVVHPDRVIILAEGSEDDNALAGVPLNEAGYNDLLDIEKTKGGSAEGFLKNASRQLGISFDSATDMNQIAEQAKRAGYNDIGEAMNDKIGKLNRGTDAALVTQSGTTSVLSVAPADPTPSWTVSANSYAATIMCPFNILFGKQTGNLASEEDKKAWAIRRNSRRNGWQSKLVTDVITRFWKVGFISPPLSGEVSVTWSDLLAPGDAEKLSNMDKMADIAVKTQQAYGTPAVDANEVRAAGELEPLEEIQLPDPNKKVTTDDPLSDDTGTKD